VQKSTPHHLSKQDWCKNQLHTISPNKTEVLKGPAIMYVLWCVIVKLSAAASQPTATLAPLSRVPYPTHELDIDKWS